MNQKKRLTANGLTLSHSLFLVCVIGMMSLSLYLTLHYFRMRFPESLSLETSICDFSSFWSCDAANFSSIAALAGIPLGFFGVLLSGFFLIGSLFPSQKMEQTNGFLAFLNGLGCTALFLYSLFFLGSLCPYCSLYYLFSWAALLLLWKKGTGVFKPDIKTLLILAAVLGVSSFAISHYTQSQEKNYASIAQSLAKQYDQLTQVGDPALSSPYRIASSTEDFSKAPLRISLFSDFQCPFCRILAAQMEKVKRRYPGKVNIQYFFYPLDGSCNSEMNSGGGHPFACKAAYLSACSQKDFSKIHDRIFDKQAELSDKLLEALAQKYQVKECYDQQTSKEAVIKSISAAKPYNVTGTPTMILNGVKIRAALPTVQMFALLDYLLEKNP